ncbi:hypothetical protein AADZ90_008125 [Aestuariibius sp. 2305UL40-4]|uniref:hypothetical protein n=1 Tax=Aestuariibius violaceus TaxID=3234132 RepID=UPI00345F154D
MIGHAALVLLASFAGAVLSAALVALIAHGIGRRDAELIDGTLRIYPNRTAIWVVVVIGIAITAGGAAIVMASSSLAGLLAALLGLAIAGFMALSLNPAHDVIWTYEFIEGPSQLFGPSLGLRRARLVWSDLFRSGKTASGYWYVEGRNGQRIYWSYLYSGHPMFLMQLRLSRPDLDLPDDLQG